jgi:hypothetical protein
MLKKRRMAAVGTSLPWTAAAGLVSLLRYNDRGDCIGSTGKSNPMYVF